MAIKPEQKSSMPGKRLRYYGFRLTEAVIERLHEVAEKKTEEVGFPVSVASLGRKYIIDGLSRES
jgi:hypothetical protein